MNPSRKLVLKHEALQELTSGELDSVVGAAAQTEFSCLDYISCWWFQCLTRRGCTE